MRKISLLLVAAFAGMTSFAQYNVLKETKAEQGLTTSDDAQRVEMAKQAKTSRAAGDVIASFDFNDGNWPTGWTTDYTTNNPGPWIIVDTTRAAQYTGKEEQLIYSTDENNKFLHLPANFYNTVPGSNPPQDLPDAQLKDLDAAFISDWIDITAANGAVQFTMNTTFRFYGNGKLELSVQTKNADGTESEWTVFDLANVNGVVVQGNQGSPKTPDPSDPTKTLNYAEQLINISSATYGQSQMKFKIRFYGTSHYYWSLDDIAIEEVSTNDMEISAIYAPSGKILTENSPPYSGVHHDHNYYATEMPANFVNIVNPGLLAHQKGLNGTNVKAEFKVDSVGTEIFTANSQYTVANFGTGQKVDKVLFTDTTGWYTNTPPARPIFFSPALTQDFFETNHLLADGIPYTFKYKISSDNEDTDMANNEASRQSFSQTLGRISYHTSSTVNDTVNSKSIVRNGFFSWAQTPKTDGVDTRGIEMWLNPGKTAAGEDATFKFYGVRVFIPKNPSDPTYPRKTTFDGAGNGVTIRAVIWKRTSEGWAKLDLTKDEGKTIKAEDLGKWCYLDLDADKVAAEDLTGGRYIMGVEMQAYNGQRLMIGSGATPGQQDGYFKARFKFSNDPAKWSWSGVSGAIMIDAYTNQAQMAYDAMVSENNVKELPSTVADEVVVFPNPTQGILKVRNAENATINVYSITGSKLLSVENQDLERTINLSNFQKGTYLIQVVKNNKVVTKKVTLL